MSLITGPSAADIVLNDRVFRHLPLIELDEVVLGRKVDYWRDWWEHQTNDEWWHQFHHRPETVDVPIFQQGGWFDPYCGSHLRKFAKIGDRVPNRLLMGPWSHEEEVESFKGDVDLGTGIGDRDPRPRARLLRPLPEGRGQRLGGASAARALRDGANEWRAEQEWPPARTEFTPWYLRSGRAGEHPRRRRRCSAPTSPVQESLPTATTTTPRIRSRRSGE